MSRLQAGALEISAVPVGLDEVLPAVLTSLGVPQGTVRLDVPETLPRVLADRGLLERALANVISNAVRFSPPGSPARVIAGAVDGVVDVRVIDRGPGVPQAERNRLFKPFQRLGDSGQSEGVGLGLARREGIRGGDGWRDRGRGHPGRRAHDRCPAAGGRMTRILVVDDEPQILRALATNLRARGYDIELAATGEAALTIAASKHPDLVILDLGLPGIEGIEVIRGLRAWTNGADHRLSRPRGRT